MGEIEGLIKEYSNFVRLPWDPNVAGPQKVWFAIYDPTQERRLRLRLADFEVATKNAGHGWRLLDLTDGFAHWMARYDYRDEYFAQPDDMGLALSDFATTIADELKQTVTESTVDANTMVALVGAGALFGLASVSALIEAAASSLQGRLLVFFPGQHDGASYRLLDARDGWNYLAIPLKARYEE